MKTTDFDYYLPPELIAQTPLEPRDSSRLMVLNHRTGLIEHTHFYNLPDYLTSGDTLVFNDSRVIPARLFGYIKKSKHRVEILLLRKKGKTWETLSRPGKKLKTGTVVQIINNTTNESGELLAEIVSEKENGMREVKFTDESLIELYGSAPLPPYIHISLTNPERYQTVYSRIKGSAAAPTAGLHFTTRLLNELQKKGIVFAFVTLHIGLDTFQPVRENDPHKHKIHCEYGELNAETAYALNKAKQEGRRIIAVGTTSVRILEATAQSGKVLPLKSNISLFIIPGYQFKVTDAVITNFHLPRSTLLMLVSALAGRENILKAYTTAMETGYRFYSFGDAMLII